MFKNNDSHMKWGRFRVHTARAKPRPPVNTEYVEDYDADANSEKLHHPPFKDDCKELAGKHTTCVRTAFQRAVVSVPVAVKPFSLAGPTSTLCCSEPIVTNVRCTGVKDRICYFTITQEICVEVPIHFGAEAHVGEPGVECLQTSLEDCEDCMESDD